MFGQLAAHFLADGVDTNGAPSLWSVIVGSVSPAAVAIGFITGKLRTESEVKRLEDTVDRKDEIIRGKDEQLTAAQAALADKAIPALVRSTSAIELLSPLIRAQVSFRAADGD